MIICWPKWRPNTRFASPNANFSNGDLCVTKCQLSVPGSWPKVAGWPMHHQMPIFWPKWRPNVSFASPNSAHQKDAHQKVAHQKDAHQKDQHQKVWHQNGAHQNGAHQKLAHIQKLDIKKLDIKKRHIKKDAFYYLIQPSQNTQRNQSSNAKCTNKIIHTYIYTVTETVLYNRSLQRSKLLILIVKSPKKKMGKETTTRNDITKKIRLL